LAKVAARHVGHLLGRLALHHGVGVVVDDRGDLGAGEDEEADPVPADLAGLGLGHQHHGQADGDVEVAGQLEQRPGGLGVVQRQQLGRRPPLLGRQAPEGPLDLAELGLQDADGVLVGAHQLLPPLGAAAAARVRAGSASAARAAR
jgi:hypothetical protein